MTPFRVAVLALALAATGAGASAQSNPPNMADPPMGQTGQMPMHHLMPGMMAHGEVQHAVVPGESGQAAFGAIQEIVEELQADPQTDWSKVDVDALRQHLIDMDEVTMRAVADNTSQGKH